MKHILILFLAFALSGCGGRQFVPEWDTGYEVNEEELEAISNATETSVIAGAGATGVGAGLLPAATSMGTFAGATTVMGVAGIIAVPLVVCHLEKCWGHEPYGDILMSGNALRGEVAPPNVFSSDPTLPSFHIYERYAEHRAFQHPGKHTLVAYPVDGLSFEWGSVPLFQESLGLQRGDLVDVYFPHMPDLERRAIVDALIYPGVVAHVVCKHDDDDCFDKFEREDDNFILGRWKTADEFKAAFEESGGFPNP